MLSKRSDEDVTRRSRVRRNSFNAFHLFCISPYTAAAWGMFSVRFRFFWELLGSSRRCQRPPTRARLGAENGLLSRNRRVRAVAAVPGADAGAWLLLAKAGGGGGRMQLVRAALARLGPSAGWGCCWGSVIPGAEVWVWFGRGEVKIRGCG